MYDNTYCGISEEGEREEVRWSALEMLLPFMKNAVALDSPPLNKMYGLVEDADIDL